MTTEFSSLMLGVIESAPFQMKMKERVSSRFRSGLIERDSDSVLDRK